MLIKLMVHIKDRKQRSYLTFLTSKVSVPENCISNPTFNMRKHQAKQERAKNYKVEFGQRGKERQRNNQDKLWGLGRKKSHTHKHSPPQFPEKTVFASGERCFPFCLPQVAATAIHCSGAPRVSALTRTHQHAPSALAVPGTNTATDGLLWTLKTKEWLQAAAAKPVSVTSPSLVFTWEGWNAIEHTL